MPTAIAFIVGLATPFILNAYVDYRRKVKHEAWVSIVTNRRLPLSEVLRLQGVYDQPEM
jgi:hypothetical protein